MSIQVQLYEFVSSPVWCCPLHHNVFFCCFADSNTCTKVVQETKRPGLWGRPHCKGMAIGVARRGRGAAAVSVRSVSPPRAVTQATPALNCSWQRTDFARWCRRA